MKLKTKNTGLQPLELNELNFSENGVLKILFLEDLESDAELVKYHIGDLTYKHEIHHVKNKTDFLEALNTDSFHFIISDYNLPQYTGIEALKHIRKLSEYTPFIICTGRVNEETAVECIKLGADDYVLKDDLSRLASAMTKAIESKRIEIQNDILVDELKAREENLRAITSNSPDAIYALDKHGKITYSSEGKEIGMPGVNDSIYSLAMENFQAIVKTNLEKCLELKTNVSFEIESEINGSKKWFSCKMGPVLDKDDVSLVLIPRDITPIKEAEENLKKLNERLNLLNNHIETVRDEEKKKIAMEIHDQLGQELIGNKLGMYWLKQNIQSENTEVQNKIDDLVDLSTQIINTVRRIAHELRPVVLDDIGLTAALDWHVDNFNKSSETKCSIEIECDDHNLDRDISTSLYRIIQEALTNINKHAEAKNAWIQLNIKDYAINLQISDDGVGIDKAKALNSKSMGLFGMQERIKPYNGIFELENSNPGTAITIKMSYK